MTTTTGSSAKGGWWRGLAGLLTNPLLLALLAGPAAYAPIASEVVYVAAPGALVPDWSLLPYTKVDRHQWPFVANPHA